jgi:hypothetical protein
MVYDAGSNFRELDLIAQLSKPDLRGNVELDGLKFQEHLSEGPEDCPLAYTPFPTEPASG